jgi:hypothetical protein
MSEEITFQDILEARSDADLLNEASLGRAYQHSVKGGHHSFGIVTGWKAGASSKENKASMKSLKHDLRSAGHGYIRMKGHWAGQSEPSLFVPGMSRAHAEHVRKKYDQDAVIHKGPESNHEVHLVTREGETHNLGKFHPRKIAQAYSSVKGAPFTFEWIANSFNEALVEKARFGTVSDDECA